jgi:hypothetical protein
VRKIDASKRLWEEHVDTNVLAKAVSSEEGGEVIKRMSPKMF